MAGAAGTLFAPVLMFSEKWLHPTAWERFRQASDQSTFLDILRFRHIPDLRDPRAFEPPNQ